MLYSVAAAGSNRKCIFDRTHLSSLHPIHDKSIEKKLDIPHMLILSVLLSNTHLFVQAGALSEGGKVSPNVVDLMVEDSSYIGQVHSSDKLT